MEVVLQENFPSLGYVGDIVKVRAGYARNYLLPRGIALEARSENAKQLRHKMAVIAAKKAKLKAQAQEESKKYEGLVLEFHLRIGEKGKSFGAISVKDIEQSLLAKGFKLDRRQIHLVDHNIKAGGDYVVEIKLHSEVVAPITARVIVERAEKKSEGEKKERKSKKAADEGGETENQAEANPSQTAAAAEGAGSGEE